MSFEASSHAGSELQSEPFRYTTTVEEGTNGDGRPGGGDAISKAQAEKREKDAFERGVREGETRVKAASEARLKAAQEGIRKGLEAFQEEREEYFNRIEPEVVQLALAIAKKILHREAQIDALLLTGLVHVALEKLDAGTRVRLRVPAADTHFWNEFFATPIGTAVPELVGDPGLQHGECVLESEVGSTQISLETQLKEIEQGFFDLLEQRPKVR